MDRTMNAAMNTKAAPALTEGFAQLAAFEPPGFPQWAALAHLGRQAAQRSDFVAANRICTACHEQYRERYRKELRARPVPAP
jgi:hypothetical protein